MQIEVIERNGNKKVLQSNVVLTDDPVAPLIRVEEINKRLTALTQDFVQAELGRNFGSRTLEDGTIVDELQERKEEFKRLHNELRTLEGKSPANYVKE